MTTLEKEIERKLVYMVKRHGGRCLKWVSPSSNGVPDRIILLPGGRVIFVETKRPKGGRPDPLQRWWAKKLTELGFDHYFVYNVDQVNWLDLVIRETGVTK